MELKVLAFSDCRTFLELPDLSPDVVFLLGDIPARMVSRIDKKYTCPKLGVFSNHCHPKNFEDTEVINLYEQVTSINGFKIAGFEGASRYKQKRFGQRSESEASNFISRINNQQIDIFIAHSNPIYEGMDSDDAHRGFESFNNMILDEQINYFFHGHLHDPFEKIIEKTTIFSVYPFLYTKINKF